MKHIGWFILDKDGISHHFIPKQTYFFGAVINKDEFTDFDETIKRVDRDWAGLAPHKIVRAYCDEGIQ